MTDAPHRDHQCSCQTNNVAGALQDSEPRSQSPRDLIAFILERYHATHRRELPELVALARRVEAVHGGNPACPRGLTLLLLRTKADLDAHMQKEEQLLFPLLMASGGGCAPFAIQRMRAEHQDHEHLLTELKRVAHDFKPPTSACSSWRRLYQGCAKLSGDLQAHIALENNLLFPPFE